MRISDWSSDVCSSDLLCPLATAEGDRPAGTLRDFVPDFNRYFGYHPIERQWRPPVWQGRSVRGQRGTTARAAYVVLVVSTVGGCEDDAAGFGAGFGRAIGLLLLLGLVTRPEERRVGKGGVRRCQSRG